MSYYQKENIFQICSQITYGTLPSSKANLPLHVVLATISIFIIGWINDIPNEENQQLVSHFVDFMKGTDTSDKYQRVNLIVVVLFAKYLGVDKRLSEADTKEEIVVFLDGLRKDSAADPDKKWIRTWNDYLQRIKYFMRWLHNYNNHSSAFSEWQ